MFEIISFCMINYLYKGFAGFGHLSLTLLKVWNDSDGMTNGGARTFNSRFKVSSIGLSTAGMLSSLFNLSAIFLVMALSH
ncbi:hypothetical protein SC499_12115 [Peribacillus simplex]|uniref:hypothetical protein n=1 Tax=Peribacillus simplex TaxID=1478 RepID=UPI00298EB872|nr:hypothetical protein [Peribacillus simplex]MDW7615447.1 hypothetical protein [Peribacillus simplex]